MTLHIIPTHYQPNKDRIITYFLFKILLTSKSHIVVLEAINKQRICIIHTKIQWKALIRYNFYSE